MRNMILFFIVLFQMAAILAVAMIDDFRVDVTIITFQYTVLFFQMLVLPTIEFKDERDN